MKQTRVYVLYHGDPSGQDGCADGFTAAWAAWRVLGGTATYLPCPYGGKIPDLHANSRVFVLDVSWSREAMDELASRMESLVVLDHHDTAEKALAGAPYAHFRKDHSGAWLAWTYFCADEPPPALVYYVEDRDLWLWKLPRSQPINAAIQNTTRDFHQWEKLHQALSSTEGAAGKLLLERGSCLVRERDRVVASMCRNAATGRVAGHVVPVVNASTYISEVGHHMLAQHKEAPFVGIWFKQADGTIRWSLRSRQLTGGKPQFHVGALAESLGGGGHPCAAGFTDYTPLDGLVAADTREFLRSVFEVVREYLCDPIMNRRMEKLVGYLRHYENWHKGKVRWLSSTREVKHGGTADLTETNPKSE